MQREVVAKSLIATKDIEPNDIFSEINIESKGPEKGLSAQYYFDIIGKKSKRRIQKEEYLLDEDLL